MTTTPIDATEFSGETVALTYRGDGGETIEAEGLVELATAVGIAFKPKRKRDVILIEPADLLSINKIEAAVDRSLRQKVLAPIDVAAARQHLVDRHGAPLAAVQAMSDQAALDAHAGIEHGPLGHKHRTPEEEAERLAKKEKATEAAETPASE